MLGSRARVTVSYPGSSTSGLVGSPVSVSIIEEVGRHTVIVSEHVGHPRELEDAMYSGSPMYAHLSNRLGDRSWHGYVDSLVLGQGQDGKPTTRVVCAGITYFLKNHGIGVMDSSLDEVERAIIRGAGLVPVVRGTSSRIQVPLIGRSQWEVLTGLAQGEGQHVISTGTTLSVLSPSDILGQFLPSAQGLRYAGATERLGYLDSFTPVSSANQRSLGGSPSSKSGAAVDPGGTALRYGTHLTDMFQGYETGGALGSATLLKDRVGMSQMVSRATASGVGHPLVFAGSPIHVDGANPGPWWFVQKVRHDFSTRTEDLRMSLDLFRTRELESISHGPSPRRNLDRKGDGGECVCQESRPDLVKDRWVRRPC